MPDSTIPEGNVSFEPAVEPPKSTVYQISRNRLEEKLIPRGKRSNLHDHSEWSGKDPNSFIRTPVTEFIGVRESLTRVEDFYLLAKRNGIDYPTISDHNTIKGALLLTGTYPNDTYVSIEYTVNGIDRKVGPEEKDYHTIHVVCPGLDFPVGKNARYDAKQVTELHKELMALRPLGYKEFARQCEKMGVRTVLAHPPFLCNPKLELEPGLFLDWINTYKYLEVNGGSQLENKLVCKMAEKYGKTLVAGNDDHYGRAVGKLYVETLDSRVSSMYDFFREFDNGKIGIGSISEGGTFEDKFNSTLSGLRKDTRRGIKEYFLREWGWRKWRFTGLSLGIPAGMVYFGSLGLGIGGALGMGLIAAGGFSAIFAGCVYGITWNQKEDERERTIALYKDLMKHFREQEFDRIDAHISAVSEDLKALIQEKNIIIKSYREDVTEFTKPAGDRSKLDRFVNWTLGGLRFLRGNYNFARDLLATGKKRKRDD